MQYVGSLIPQNLPREGAEGKMYPIQTVAEVLPDIWRLAGQVGRGLQEARYSAPESLAAVWKVLLAPAVVEATARSLPVWRRIAALQGG